MAGKEDLIRRMAMASSAVQVHSNGGSEHVPDEDTEEYEQHEEDYVEDSSAESASDTESDPRGQIQQSVKAEQGSVRVRKKPGPKPLSERGVVSSAETKAKASQKQTEDEETTSDYGYLESILKVLAYKLLEKAEQEGVVLDGFSQEETAPVWHYIKSKFK